MKCHVDHTVFELFQKRGFRCDCGTVKSQCQCVFVCSEEGKEKEKEATRPNNTDNNYNHNFDGLYCWCNTAYDHSEEGVIMLQCLRCQDWFHEECIKKKSSKSIPDEDDFADFICVDCLQVCPFLLKYPLERVYVEEEAADSVQEERQLQTKKENEEKEKEKEKETEEKEVIKEERTGEEGVGKEKKKEKEKDKEKEAKIKNKEEKEDCRENEQARGSKRKRLVLATTKDEEESEEQCRIAGKHCLSRTESNMAQLLTSSKNRCKRHRHTRELVLERRLEIAPLHLHRLS
jgi:hypothetical protein